MVDLTREMSITAESMPKNQLGIRTATAQVKRNVFKPSRGRAYALAQGLFVTQIFGAMFVLGPKQCG